MKEKANVLMRVCERHPDLVSGGGEYRGQGERF